MSELKNSEKWELEASRRWHMTTGTFHSKSCTSGAGAYPSATVSLRLLPLTYFQFQKSLVIGVRSLEIALLEFF